MTTPVKAQHFAGVEVRLGGTALEPQMAAQLLEVRVQDSLTLPDAFLLRLGDPELEHVDSGPFDVGAEVEILFAAPDAATLTSLIKGQITTSEPEFGPEGAILAARGYDHAHSLNRTRRSETFQNVTADDVARKVADRAGLRTGTIDDAGVAHDFVQQSSETDWELLLRLAAAIDFEVVVEDRALHFRRASGSDRGQAPTLRWGERLRSFSPRITGVAQVDEVLVRGWDPQGKQAISASARAEELSAEIGVTRDELVSSLGGGTVTVADRPVSTQAEADALARSVAAQLGNAFVEAQGVTDGDPGLRAGRQVTIDGVGAKFGGTYTLSATTHLFRGSKGYQTSFQITGRTPRGLLDLMSQAPRRKWAEGPVVGVVTQNQDPDGLGRVRVKYPELGDENEGWWARLASPSAGSGRGLLMMPVVGEEVLLCFEHGDVRRPYVLGSLWNGKEKPEALAQTDGSFALRSDEKVVIESTGDFSVSSDSGDVSVSSDSGKVSVSAGTDVVIEAQTSVTIKAPSLKLEASGVVEISGSQIALG
ncbi:MAG: VgrG-related protein [Solirubrobacterales bacterium]